MSRGEVHKFVLQPDAGVNSGEGDTIQTADYSDKWLQVEIDGGSTATLQIQGRIGTLWVSEGAAITASTVVAVNPRYSAMRVKTTVNFTGPATGVRVFLGARQERTEG